MNVSLYTNTSFYVSNYEQTKTKRVVNNTAVVIKINHEKKN